MINRTLAIVNAIEQCDISVMRALLESEADPNGMAIAPAGYGFDEQGRPIETSEEQTPLSAAVKRLNCVAVETLLKFGASPDLFPNADEAPIALAAASGSVPLVSLLIQYGADIERCGASGRTALQWAVRMNRPKIVDLLLDSGAQGAEDAMVWAIELDRTVIVDILAARGITAPASQSKTEQEDIFANPRRYNRNTRE